MPFFEIPVEMVPTALEMSLLCVLRHRKINKDRWEKKAAFPDCQVRYNFVIEVSCSAFGKGWDYMLFLSVYLKKVRYKLQINP